jgi:hypothetical protein
MRSPGSKRSLVVTDSLDLAGMWARPGRIMSLALKDALRALRSTRIIPLTASVRR